MHVYIHRRLVERANIEMVGVQDEEKERKINKTLAHSLSDAAHRFRLFKLLLVEFLLG